MAENAEWVQAIVNSGDRDSTSGPASKVAGTVRVRGRLGGKGTGMWG